MRLRIANAPCSWGIEPPDRMTDPPWELVLEEIAASGYAGTELGPYGYMPTQASVVAAGLERHHLALAAGFVMGPFSSRGRRGEIEQNAREVCALLAANGARTLVVIDDVSSERASTAGRSDVAQRLGRSEWQALVDSISRVADIAAEAGLVAAIHPHAGTHVEFDDEVERLLGALDPELIGLCLDTGHATYAGIDPLALLNRHADRLSYVHLKDIDAERIETARKEGQSFVDAVTAGIFRPLGAGCVDLPAIAERLGRIGYSGWITVEQDRLPDSSMTPREEACLSRDYLAQIGLA